MSRNDHPGQNGRRGDRAAKRACFPERQMTPVTTGHNDLVVRRHGRDVRAADPGRFR
jgi:hypothetical protein